MTAPITYRAMQVGDIPAVSALVWNTFEAFIAPDYGDEGIQTFSRFVQPDALRERIYKGALFLLAEVETTLAGMIEMNGSSHITLLFVDAAFQGRGISRELLRHALDICKQRLPDLDLVTVHSSPYAVEIYRRLGFVALSPQQKRSGILYTPMALFV